jgi:predicted O-methyltransferase YrrM
MTALIDTLFQLEKYLGLELDSLMPYAEADNIGGYHPDAAQRKWWTGAIWEVEGKTLYALIRALQPETVVEVGSGTGCSSTHMAAALKANGGGHVTTVDRGNTPQIPADLQVFVTILPGDGIDYLALLPDNSVDFILEDADHTKDMCAAIGELAKTKLKPGGVLMAHDAAHFAVGADVKAGYDLAGLDFRVYLTDPSDCGWAVWKRPDGRIGLLQPDKIMQGLDAFNEVVNPEADDSPVIDTTVLQAQEEYPDVVSEVQAEPWTPSTLSDGQKEMLNLDAKWQAEDKAATPPAEKKVKRTRKAKAKKQ